MTLFGGASGGDGETDGAVRREVEADPAVRAVDARRVEGLDGQFTVAPGAFDVDHAARLNPGRDS